MKLAFVNISVENTPTEQARLDAVFPDREDTKEFSDIWKAVVFAKTSTNSKILVNQKDASKYQFALKTAVSSGVSLVEVPDEHETASEAADWLINDGELPTTGNEETAEVTAVVSTPEESNPMEELGEDLEDDDDGYVDAGISFTDLINEPQEEAPQIVGLNQKIQITPDMIKQEEQKKNGRVPYEPSELGYLMTITSAFGGGGKTTMSYYSAQIMQMALKNAKNTRTRVILIEADYGNPKIQGRLKIPAGQDFSKLANFLEAVDRGEIDQDKINEMAEQIIEDIIYEDSASGVKIIACPYDTTRASEPAMQQAIKKTIMWAQRTMGWFVVVDADTLGHPHGMELDMIEMSNRVVVITNTTVPQVIKKKRFFRKEVMDSKNPNDRSHIDDALTMIHKLTKPVAGNGYGIPGNRIRVFFNETSPEELDAKVLQKDIFPKNMVVGNLPRIPEIDKAWAGDVSRNRNRAIEVAKNVAEFLLRTTEYREVDQLLKSMRTG